jgi:hypothetical protein
LVLVFIAVPWFSRLADGLSPQRPGFDTGTILMSFMVEKLALGEVLQFSFSVTFHHCSTLIFIFKPSEEKNKLAKT